MAMTPRPRSRAGGFTLIEMLVTLAVIAVLAAIALPSFTQSIRRNAVSTASNALLADLGYARAEAVTRGMDVSVCPSTDGTSCSDGAAWESGWLVYTYTPGHAVANTDYDHTSSADVLLRRTTARNGVSIQADSSTVVTFGPQGDLKPSGSGFSLATCYSTDSGTGHSTATVPGSLLSVQVSGNVVNTTLAADDSACTFPAPSP